MSSIPVSYKGINSDRLFVADTSEDCAVSIKTNLTARSVVNNRIRSGSDNTLNTSLLDKRDVTHITFEEQPASIGENGCDCCVVAFIIAGMVCAMPLFIVGSLHPEDCWPLILIGGGGILSGIAVSIETCRVEAKKGKRACWRQLID